MRNPKSKIQNRKLKIENCGNLKMMGDAQSKIENPKSKIEKC